MSRFSPNPSRPVARDAERIAAVHRVAGSLRVVVARVAPGQCEAVAVRTIPDAQAREGLRILVKEQRVTRLLWVVPSAGTLCRVVTLPGAESASTPSGDADDGQAAAALALIAEAELPSSLPAHRRAWGMLSGSTPGSPPLCIVLGWPTAALDPAQGLASDEQEHSWIPEVASLASLVVAGPVPSESAVTLDAGTGTVAAVAFGPTKSIARVARVDATTSTTLQSGALAILAETRRVAGLAAHAPDAIPTDRPLFTQTAGAAGSPVRLTLPSTGSDADSCRSTHASALGALLTWALPGKSAAGLARMTRDPEDHSASPVITAVNWLAEPRRAAIAIAACVGVLLLLPFAVAAGRSTIIESRAGGASALEARVNAANSQAAFYELLRARRWPMTKLLADVTGSAPVGIRLDAVELSADQGASGGVTIRGDAESTDVLNKFRQNLQELRVFDDVVTPSITAAPSGDRVEFRLQARVVGPLIRREPADDFAKTPLAVRMYGEDARHTAASTDSESASGDRSGRFRRSDDEHGNAGRDGGDGSRTSRRTSRTPAAAAPEAKPGELPAPLTDDAIAKMDSKTAGDEYRKRNAAAYQQGVDETTKQRLLDEAQKTKARMIQAINEKHK